MNIIVIVVGLLIPALIWILYFYWRDRHFPEPPVNLIIAYILGILTAMIYIKIFYDIVPNQINMLAGNPDDFLTSLKSEQKWGQCFLYCIGIIGFFEELFKMLPFLIVVVHFKQFDETVDAIIYAAMISLGLATYENIHYLRNLALGGEFFANALLRPLIHTMFSTIWGYIIGQAWFSHKSLVVAIIKGLLIAAILHGFYDFLCYCLGSRIFVSLAALLVGAILIWSINTIEKIAKDGTTGKG